MTNTLFSLLPDELYLRLLYYRTLKRPLRLKNPLLFTEKVQWLKLYGKLENNARYADKYTVRKYIEEKVGSEFLIPLLGVWDRFDQIPFDQLPNQFVLKVTHGCGYNYVCKDKSSIDYSKLKVLITTWLNEDFYKQEREPQYRYCKPRIICEQYLEDATGGLRDYKFFCSNGNPQIIQVDSDRFTNHRSDLFDLNWKRLDHITVATFGSVEETIPKPRSLTRMIRLAKKLAEDFPFVRVDLYSVGDKVYFGELTFTPGSGIINFQPLSGDIELGKLIDLKAYQGQGA